MESRSKQFYRRELVPLMLYRRRPRYPMKAKRISWLNTLFGFTYGLSLMGAAPLAAQDSCQPVNDAMDKTMTVPTHIYSTMNTASNGVGKPILAETIYTGGATYVKIASKWTRGPWTTQQVMKREQENRQKSKFSCHYLREESVNGETAAVYSTHSETLASRPPTARYGFPRAGGCHCATNSTWTPEMLTRNTIPPAMNTPTSRLRPCEALAGLSRR
jgi:hypothetical protein